MVGWAAWCVLLFELHRIYVVSLRVNRPVYDSPLHDTATYDLLVVVSGTHTLPAGVLAEGGCHIGHTGIYLRSLRDRWQPLHPRRRRR